MAKNPEEPVGAGTDGHPNLKSSGYTPEQRLGVAPAQRKPPVRDWGTGSYDAKGRASSSLKVAATGNQSSSAGACTTGSIKDKSFEPGRW